MDAVQNETRLMLENACTEAASEFAKNPNDADNLTRWGRALMDLSQYQDTFESDEMLQESNEMLQDAISKLNKALAINPAQHEALWCLGNCLSACAFQISNQDKAKALFDQASKCFQNAVKKCPENERYLNSLANSVEAHEVLKDIYKRPVCSSAMVLYQKKSKKSIASINVLNNQERFMMLEFARVQARSEFAKNPNDANNLTRWGQALLELSQEDCSTKMLKDAISKLDMALAINPAKHEALWCLGNCHSAIAFECFQSAVEKCPENERYINSLATCSKAYQEIYKHGHSSGAKGSGKDKSSVLKYYIFGSIILVVGLVASFFL